MCAMRSWWSGATCRVAVLAGAFLAVAAAPAAAQDPQPNLFTTIGITTEQTRENSGIRGPYSLPAEEMPPSRTVGPGPSRHGRRRAAADARHVRQPAEPRGLRGPDADARRRRPEGATRGSTSSGPRPTARAAATSCSRTPTASTQSVPAAFPDWCQSGHWAIGPLSKRWTPTGSDGAPCGIFHVPAEIDEAKTLVSVKLPREHHERGRQRDLLPHGAHARAARRRLRAAGPLGARALRRRGRRAGHRPRVLARRAERQRAAGTRAPCG